ncbi:MAG: PfkB family carbohydrate kinase [bacterium]|nr:PfkB family carbohydrate kinase [bacterium]
MDSLIQTTSRDLLPSHTGKNGGNGSADSRTLVHKKIKTIDQLARILHDLRSQGKTIVQCHGVFDLLHPGHMKHLQSARQHGDILVVTLTPDRFVNKGPGRPVFNQRIRTESLAALQCVDYVAMNTCPTAIEVIERLCPHIFAKGNEFADRKVDLTGAISEEEEAVRRIGGRLLLTDEETFSSSELLNRYYSVYPPEAEAFLNRFRGRYSSGDVISKLNSMKDLKVLVIGEAIVDEYHYCNPMGKSTKESIVTSKYIRSESFAGGSLACANHIAGFCDRVDLVTCLGEQDTQEDFIRKNLKNNINPTFFYRPDAPTIVKRRYVWEPFLTKLFELYIFEDTDIDEKVEHDLQQHLEATLAEYDLVLVTDYGHGMMTRPIVEQLCKSARFLAVNTQTNSANAGYNLITKYPRADYVCIDEPEIRLAANSRSGEVSDLADKMATRLNTRTLTVTRGHKGSLSCARGEDPVQVPIFSTEVKDRVGAGDAFLAVTAPAICAGLDTELVGFIGNAVGALAVRIVGNKTPVEPVPLQRFVTALLK